MPPGGLNGVSGAPHPRWPPYIVYVVKTARVRSVELKQLSTKFFLHYISDITHCAMTERKMEKNLLFFSLFFHVLFLFCCLYNMSDTDIGAVHNEQI